MKKILSYLYKSLLTQNKNADAKFSISITLATALTVFSATYLNNSFSLITALSAISIIFSLISVIYGFLGITNRHFYRVKYKNFDKKLNVFSYKELSKINERNLIEYLLKNYKKIKGYKIDEFDLNLSFQIVETAKSINQKHLFFNFSIIFLFVSLLSESSAIFLLGMNILV